MALSLLGISIGFFYLLASYIHQLAGLYADIFPRGDKFGVRIKEGAEAYVGCYTLTLARGARMTQGGQMPLPSPPPLPWLVCVSMHRHLLLLFFNLRIVDNFRTKDKLHFHDSTFCHLRKEDNLQTKDKLHFHDSTFVISEKRTTSEQRTSCISISHSDSTFCHLRKEDNLSPRGKEPIPQFVPCRYLESLVALTGSPPPPPFNCKLSIKSQPSTELGMR